MRVAELPEAAEAILVLRGRSIMMMCVVYIGC